MSTPSQPGRGSAAATLRKHWLERAFERAGIDRSRWRPDVGVAENRATIEAVYAYYARLYLEHPAFLWAGMASLVGPAFYAGFEDMGALPDRARRFVSARVLRRGDGPVGELSFYETTFLVMQQKIFEDQALLHEAYLGGGLAGIRELYDAGIIDRAMVRAWTQIATGDRAAIDSGNRALLMREQYQIIDNYYRHMYLRRAPEGGIITYLMTLAGEPSLPGARTYPAVFPLTLRVRVPGARRILSLTTPAPAGDIAIFANRWRLITRDTLPAYRRLLATDPEGMRALVAQPIAQRVGRYRVARRLGRLALAGATAWRVALPPAAVAVGPAVANASAEVGVDLHDSAARVHALATDDAARSSRPGRSFDLSVRLPEERTFRTRAVLATVAAESADGAGRLAVRMPAQAGLVETLGMLRGLAREWGLDPAEVETWGEHAQAVAATRPHLYSTRVFHGRDVGSVHVECQVEHHVVEHEFVLHVFFSW
ncbi:MAG TPA: hypothetical protein VGI72_13485 [Gaiellales bacterium]